MSADLESLRAARVSAHARYVEARDRAERWRKDHPQRNLTFRERDVREMFDAPATEAAVASGDALHAYRAAGGTDDV